jgi:tetratricopeptide (TPR) repeat protein/TolB-like protein
MAIWSAEIKELEKLYESLKGQLPDLEKEMERLIKADDENMILLYSRRCLEVIITDLCECELKRPRKTEPLKGIIDKLHKEEKVPSHIITSMHGLNDLSTYGAHPKDFDPEQVKPVLVNLDIIIKWYIKYKGSGVIRKDESIPGKDSAKHTEIAAQEIRKPKKNLGLILTSILLIIAVIVFSKIFRRNTLEKIRTSGERISVAVMPFQNMTNDTIWDKWEEVVQTNITTFLSNYPEELKVRQAELVTKILQSKGLANYYSITSSVASSISEKLDADVFINGSINQSGSTIRLNALLVDSKTEDALKSFQIDGTDENILPIIDSLSVIIKNVLVISKLGKEFPPEIMRLWSVNSPEAFIYFKSGQDAFNNRDWAAAANFYSQAITIDSSFTFATIMLSFAYLNQEMYDQAKKWCLKGYKRKDQMTIQQEMMINWLYATCFEDPYEQIKYLKQLLDTDEQSPNYHFLLGLAYWELNQYDKAIPEYEKSLAIYNKLGIKPQYTGNYSHLLSLYYITGQYEKEKELYKKAEIDRPDNSDLMAGQAVLSLSEGGIIAANSYIEKYISIRREQSKSEASIMSDLANIYSEANIPDKAEEYYRKSLSLEPENPYYLNYLAYFLIDKDRNLNEGMELVEKALELSPENYKYLHAKGWGLYKQGKYQEAFKILQKSWDLRREKAVYYHEDYLHLEAAKKAVVNQKKTDR